MNIVIDHGNSAAKVGIFDHQNLVEKHTLNGSVTLKDLLSRSKADHVIVSSVKGDADEIASWVPGHGLRFTMHHTLPVPVKNLYATRETLGMDRLAAVCGAWQLFPQQDCLVIDTGTCLKFDFLDSAGNYHGGAISPGLAMRFKALNTFTAKLPLVTAKANVALTGNSTETSIRSGVVNGILAEMDGIVSQYEQKYPGLRVILSGGDTAFFENQVKASIFASPELVLIGLNSILIHNVNRS